MTENKRFTVYGKEIVQDDECWAVAYSEYNADVIATALNELAEENTQLKNKLKFLNELNKPYGTIIEENQRLKEQLHQREVAKQRRIDYDEFWSQKKEHLAWKRVDVE